MQLSDATLQATALREAYEELGIDPSAVKFIGALPVVETMTSNYAISAFVVRLPARPNLVLQASEVAVVLDVPVGADLGTAGLPVEEEWPFPVSGDGTRAVTPSGSPPPGVAVRWRKVRYFPWEPDKIWGATERMLELFLAAL